MDWGPVGWLVGLVSRLLSLQAPVAWPGYCLTLLHQVPVGAEWWHSPPHTPTWPQSPGVHRWAGCSLSEPSKVGLRSLSRLCHLLKMSLGIPLGWAGGSACAWWGCRQGLSACCDLGCDAVPRAGLAVLSVWLLGSLRSGEARCAPRAAPPCSLVLSPWARTPTLPGSLHFYISGVRSFCGASGGAGHLSLLSEG